MNRWVWLRWFFKVKLLLRCEVGELEEVAAFAALSVLL
jgi:hypothetical protein